VPASLSPAAEHSVRDAKSGGPDDADLDAACSQPLVELACAALRVRPLLVDDEPHGDSRGRLREESLRELVADEPRAEAELVDVDRGLGRRDVLEHPRIEGLALDEHLRARCAALGERERERAPLDGAAREQTLGVLTEPVVRHGHGGPCHAGASAATRGSARRSKSFASSATATKTIGPSRHTPHCLLVSETVSRIRWRNESSVARKVSTSVTPISCTKRRFAIV